MVAPQMYLPASESALLFLYVRRISADADDRRDAPSGADRRRRAHLPRPAPRFWAAAPWRFGSRRWMGQRASPAARAVESSLGWHTVAGCRAGTRAAARPPQASRSLARARPPPGS